jgi:halocyanin-like protein
VNSETPADDSGATAVTRRTLLRGGAGAVAAGAGATAISGTAAAQSAPSFDGWMNGVQNYSSVIDRTGSDEVTVQVGVNNGGQPYGFGPAAIRIDPGTTVVWEWTGKGNQHNVVDDGGAFESELVAEAGHTFEQTFEEAGVTKYYCQPHQALGMKGVVVTGDVELGGGGEPFEPPGGGIGLAFFGLMFGMLGIAAAGILGGDAYQSFRTWYDEVNAVEGPAVESSMAEEHVEETVDHDEFNPKGTAALLIGYFLVLVVMWFLMYFVEFIGGGPTIVG